MTAAGDNGGLGSAQHNTHASGVITKALNPSYRGQMVYDHKEIHLVYGLPQLML